MGILYAHLQELPDIRNLSEFKPMHATRLYDIHGKLIAQIGSEQRTFVPLSDIPLIMQKALISIEDARFYDHGALDYIGIARAFIINVLHGGVLEGGSTLTQQLARNLFLTPQRTLSRKIREALLAIQLAKNFTKNQILDMYFNQIYFGQGAYGIEAASRIYFGVNCKDLTLPECAMIAALPKAPSYYDPYVHPIQAVARRNLVLKAMHSQGYITKSEEELAEIAPLVLKSTNVENAPYFVEYVQQELENEFGPQAVYKDGLSVYTTLNLRLQEAAHKAVQEGLKQIEDRTHKIIYANIPNQQPLQAALLCIDPHTGAIRAMVGGRNFNKSMFNRAIQAERQPGSSFKPIVYTTALEQGYTMADIILDAPIVFKNANGTTWSPEDYDNHFHGPTTLHYALENSINVVTIKLLNNIGIDPVIRMARKMGITSPLTPNLTLALGSSDVTLEELVRAYSIFDNQGIRVEPFGILYVKNANGKTIEITHSQAVSVIDPQTAYIITHTLESVINHGTGQLIRQLGFTYPAAGKTGTTNNEIDAWFIGYTPQLTCGVWVGYDQRQSIGPNEVGGYAAAPIWENFMKHALENQKPENFTVPPGIVEKRICNRTGLLAIPGCCQHTTLEVFKKDTVPLRHCKGTFNQISSFYGSLSTNVVASQPTPIKNAPTSSGDIYMIESHRASVPQPTATAVISNHLFDLLHPQVHSKISNPAFNPVFTPIPTATPSSSSIEGF
jgi:penicillin-binding protein 1A